MLGLVFVRLERLVSEGKTTTIPTLAIHHDLLKGQVMLARMRYVVFDELKKSLYREEKKQNFYHCRQLIKHHIQADRLASYLPKQAMT